MLNEGGVVRFEGATATFCENEALVSAAPTLPTAKDAPPRKGKGGRERSC